MVAGSSRFAVPVLVESAPSTDFAAYLGTVGIDTMVDIAEVQLVPYFGN